MQGHAQMVHPEGDYSEGSRMGKAEGMLAMHGILPYQLAMASKPSIQRSPEAKRERMELRVTTAAKAMI